MLYCIRSPVMGVGCRPELILIFPRLYFSRFRHKVTCYVCRVACYVELCNHAHFSIMLNWLV